MEDKKEEGTCGKGGCGIHCGCCTCKAIKAAALLLIGGAIGFGIARCGSRQMCPMPAAVSMQMENTPTAAATAAPKKVKKDTPAK